MTRPDPLVFSDLVTRPDPRMDPTRGQLWSAYVAPVQNDVFVGSLCTHVHFSSIDQRSVEYKGSILWNGEINSIRSTISFVEKLKRILL